MRAPRRELRAGEPEIHPVRTDDGVELRLTRHRGGDRGPVLLTHGLGVSSGIFTTDTIDTNLLEHLYEGGWDVWLLDYRASIDLPVSRSSFTADDVALFDYPAAVKGVLERTGADSVQVVAHCFGATTFTMAMLAGLEHVRAAVCSQVSVDVAASRGSRVKSALRLGTVLQLLGAQRLTARTTGGRNLFARAWDAGLRLLPARADDRCGSAACRRISFMYSPLYEHAQLAPETHASLDELFGRANMRTMNHLSRIVRAGHVVAADGSERYLPHLDRLAIPLLFVHGALNRCFLPVSTERTLDRLSAANGAELYKRVVVPRYGHIDCIFGRDAARDVFPAISSHLAETAA